MLRGAPRLELPKWSRSEALQDLRLGPQYVDSGNLIRIWSKPSSIPRQEEYFCLKGPETMIVLAKQARDQKQVAQLGA